MSTEDNFSTCASTQGEIVPPQRAPTWAAELFALDLSDPFVGEPSGAGAARAARLNGIVLQVVCQPLQMAVTDKRVLG